MAQNLRNSLELCPRSSALWSGALQEYVTNKISCVRDIDKVNAIRVALVNTWWSDSVFGENIFDQVCRVANVHSAAIIGVTGRVAT